MNFFIKPNKTGAQKFKADFQEEIRYEKKKLEQQNWKKQSSMGKRQKHCKGESRTKVITKMYKETNKP